MVEPCPDLETYLDPYLARAEGIAGSVVAQQLFTADLDVDRCEICHDTEERRGDRIPGGRAGEILGRAVGEKITGHQWVVDAGVVDGCTRQRQVSPRRKHHAGFERR